MFLLTARPLLNSFQIFEIWPREGIRQENEWGTPTQSGLVVCRLLDFTKTCRYTRSFADLIRMPSATVKGGGGWLRLNRCKAHVERETIRACRTLQDPVNFFAGSCSFNINLLIVTARAVSFNFLRCNKRL
jgi:hypothetical protein